MQTLAILLPFSGSKFDDIIIVRIPLVFGAKVEGETLVLGQWTRIIKRIFPRSRSLLSRMLSLLQNFSQKISTRVCELMSSAHL